MGSSRLGGTVSVCVMTSGSEEGAGTGTMCLNTMPLTGHLNMFQMAHFMFCGVYHNKKTIPVACPCAIVRISGDDADRGRGAQ